MVTKQPHTAARKVAGIGYIILNGNMPRENYIKSCYKNQMVNIITNEGETIPNCLVANGVWNHLQFPANSNEQGSSVIWHNIPFYERVVITGILKKRDELLEHSDENKIIFKRKVDENLFNLIADGVQGKLDIIVQGKEQDQAEINLKILNEIEKGLLDLYVQGDINASVEHNVDFRIGNAVTILVRDDSNPSKSAKITYKLGEGFKLEDEFGNIVRTTGDGVFLEVDSADKIYTVSKNNTGQPAVLGDNLYDMLDENNKLLKTLIQAIDTASKNSPTMSTAPFILALPVLKLNMKNLQLKINKIKAQNLNLT